MAASPAGTAPEIHALLGVTTAIVFDAEIDQTSVQVDRTRVKLVDVGARSILFVPLLEIGLGERLGLTVRYAAGGSPEQAHFAIVSRPPTVDTVLSVLRGPQSLAACQAELAQAREGCADATAPLWDLADRLAGEGVEALVLDPKQGATSGLWIRKIYIYRFNKSGFIVAWVKNPPGQPSWLPQSAALTCERTRVSVKVRRMSVRSQNTQAGGMTEVAVETELPPPGTGPRFTLELRGANEQTQSQPFTLPPAPKEKAAE
jgi:uncharacterized protein (TIGR02268 family)